MQYNKLKYMYLARFLLSILFIAILPTIAICEPIRRCGVVVAMSGHLASSGNSIKNAIVLAREQKPNSKVDFIYEDDQFVPSKTVSSVRKLIEVQKIDCLITFGSPTSMAVADIAEKANIPLISIAITTKVVMNRPHVFLAFISSATQNKAIISEVKRKAYGSVAVVTTISDGTLELRDLFVKSAVAKIVSDIEVNPEDSDLKAVATKINQEKPASVFINLLPPQAAIFAKQLRNLGYKGDFFSGPPIGNPAEVKASNGALYGTWFVSLDSGKANQYYEAYERRFNETSAMQGLYGYDAANLFMSAAETDDIFKYLSNLRSVDGNLGKYSITNNLIDMPAGLWRIGESGFDFCGSDCALDNN